MADKKITELVLIDEATDDVNFAGDDGVQTYRVTAAQLKQFILETTTPIGSVSAFAGSALTGNSWLFCDGSLISRTEYSELFSIIGTAYGAGDGTTTFKLPDLRGEFIRGLDSGRGIDSGRTLGSSQTDTIQEMTGQVTLDTNQGSFSGDSGVFDLTNSGTKYINNSGAVSSGFKRLEFIASQVARTSDETRPRNIALNYIIKAKK